MKWIKYTGRWSWYLIAVAIILFALALSVLRASTLILNARTARVEHWLSEILQQPVKIGQVFGGWQGFSPSLNFHHVVVMSATSHRVLLQVKQLAVRFNLLNNLLDWNVKPASVRIKGANLNVFQQASGGFSFRNAVKSAGIKRKPFHFSDGARWLLQQTQLSLRGITVHFHALHGPPLLLSHVQCRVLTSGELHRLAIRFNLGAGSAYLVAHFKRSHWRQAQAFLQLKKFRLVPELKLPVQGVVSGRVWFGKQWLGEMNWHEGQRSLQGVFMRQGHEWTLRAKRVVYDLPPMQLFAHVVNGKHQVDIKTLALKNQSIALRGRGVYLKGHTPRLHFLASFRILNTRVFPVLFPKAYLSKAGYAWLSQAFVQGHSDVGSLVFRGALNAFPFSAYQGSFEAGAHVAGVQLHYQAGWPDLYQVAANVLFHDGQFSMADGLGQIFGNHLQQMTARIPNLLSPRLTINALASGQLQQALSFVQQTPLTVKTRLAKLKGVGPMRLHLQLYFPLYQKDPKTTVHGELKLLDDQLILPKWQLTLNKLQGILSFYNSRIVAKQLHANWFGELLKLGVVTHQGVRVSVAGRLPIHQLILKYQPKMNKWINGAPRFHALLVLEKVSQFDLWSQFQGVQFKVPKLMVPVAPLHVSLTLSQRVQLQATYGHILYGDSVWRAGAFYGAKISTSPVKPVRQAGLFVQAKLPQLTWMNWQPLLTAFQSTGSEQLLRHISLRVGMLNVFGQSFPKVKLIAVPTKKSWKLNINSPRLMGKIDYQSEPFKLIAKLNYIYLNAIHAGRLIKKMPQLDVSATHFHFGKQDLGAVTLQANPVPLGLDVRHFSAHPGGCLLQGAGYWRWVKSSFFRWKGSVQCHDFGGFLRHFQVTSGMVGGMGNVTFAGGWAGSPFSFNVKKLQADVKYYLKNGVIVHLDKSTEHDLGVGKLLNIFSFQSLPKRLAGNFSDLSSAGFSYNIMQGELLFNKGQARLRNTYLKGPVAKVGVNGSLNLLAKTYNLRVSVLPYLTSNLPLLATVAGGPLVGAITWLADTVVNPIVAKAVEKVYPVKGNWQPKLPKPQ